MGFLGFLRCKTVLHYWFDWRYICAMLIGYARVSTDDQDTAGRMMMQMVGAFAEFEKSMLKERTKAGLDAARQEGRIGGRRPKLSPQQQAEIRKMVSKGRKTAADAARLFKVHPATVSRLLTRAYAK